jgi:tetratricopeptide (TPR) repeat protein
MKIISKYFLFLVLIASILTSKIINSKVALSQDNAIDEAHLTSKIICKELPKKACREKSRNPNLSVDIVTPSPEGYLLSNKPSISWLPIQKVQEYIVTLQQVGKDKRVWQQKSSTTKIPYPNDKPVLEENQIYKLNIQPISATNNVTPDIELKLLSEAESHKIETEKQKIIEEKLSPEKESFKLAELYSSNQLFTDAISVFDDKPRNVTVLLRLGYLYLLAGQPTLSEQSYKEALTKARDTNDKAEAELGLGLAGDRKKASESAISSLVNAFNTYEKLNKQLTAAYISQYLGEMYESTNKIEAKRWYNTAANKYKLLKETERQNYIETKLKTL